MDSEKPLAGLSRNARKLGRRRTKTFAETIQPGKARPVFSLAVAIAGDRPFAVGSNADVLRLATARTRKIDLDIQTR